MNCGHNPNLLLLLSLNGTSRELLTLTASAVGPLWIGQIVEKFGCGLLVLSVPAPGNAPLTAHLGMCNPGNLPALGLEGESPIGSDPRCVFEPIREG